MTPGVVCSRTEVLREMDGEVTTWKLPQVQLGLEAYLICYIIITRRLMYMDQEKRISDCLRPRGTLELQ